MPVRTLNSIVKRNKEESPEADTDADTDMDIEPVEKKPAAVRKSTFQQLPEQPAPVAEPVPRKKREISDEQKDILRKRLENARAIRKQQADEKKRIEEMLMREKEKEVKQKIMTKVQKLSKKQEVQALKKYIEPDPESEEEEEEEEYIPPVKPRRQVANNRPAPARPQPAPAPAPVPVPPPLRFL